MRDQLRDKAYYDQWIDFTEDAIKKRLQRLDTLKDEGKALCVSSLVNYAHDTIFMRYSRGDTIESMRDSVQKSYEILQLRREVLNNIKIKESTLQMWENLSHDNLYRVLTLVSFMVSLRSSAEDILNVLKLVGHEGEDALLALVAKHFGRESSDVPTSKYPDIYSDLVALMHVDAEKQPILLKKYVERWRKLMKAMGWADTHKGAEGAYVGYWCFEVALVVMLLGIDDSLVAEHPHYPADLVRHYRQQA